MTVRLTLNGTTLVDERVDPEKSLLNWLRDSGYTGTKEGCAEGECGACAVALLGRDAHGRAHYESVNSCLLPMGLLEGREVVTVEGVADPDGTLHPVQELMVAAGGSQCGYCTPGFVISLFCEYYRPGRVAPDAEAISGNLCRCTGYRPIAEVLRKLPAPAADDRRLAVLARGPSPVRAALHIASGHHFERPTTLAALFDCLGRMPNATLIAGGTDLMVLANQRFERFATLVSVDSVAELNVLERRGDELVLGAGVTLSRIEERCGKAGDLYVPLLAELLPLFSSRLIRNRATLGGNLATASPIGDAAPVLLALGAELVLSSESGERRLPLTDFFRDYRKTALSLGEVIESVRIPLPQPRFQRFYKVSKRVLDDISSVAAAFTVELDAEGRLERLRMAFGGIGATPLRATELEDGVRGRKPSPETARLLAAGLATFGTPLSDQRASAEYRRAMLGKLVEKFFAEELTREEAAE